MKKVLFISNSYYDFEKSERVLHLAKKFKGLSQGVGSEQGIAPYILGRGRPFLKKQWGTSFYLLPNKFLFFLSAFCMGFWLCLIKRINVVICQSPLFEGFIGAVLARMLGIELIIEAHGDWDSIFLARKRRLESLQKKIARFFVRVSFHTADKVRVVANYLLAKTKKFAPNIPHFIFPTFTDLDIFLNAKDIVYENFILFVGVLYKIKGVEYLLEAVHILSDNKLGRPSRFVVGGIGDFRVVIVGDGPERKDLERQANKLGIGDMVEFLGRLPLEQVRDIMKRCYCLVLPSLSEGLPRVILEAMALAKPVVAADVGGIGDLIKHNQNGFLCAPRDANDLAKNLKILLANNQMAASLGQNGRQFISVKFSNNDYVKNYLSMINLSKGQKDLSDIKYEY